MLYIKTTKSQLPVIVTQEYDFEIRGVFTSHVDAVKFVISEGRLERPDDHIYETTMRVESLVRDCCDGETRDDIINSFANRLGIPKLLELTKEESEN